MTEKEFEQLIKALKTKALGNEITTIIETAVKNDEGEMIIKDRQIKKVKNDIDTQACIKLIDLETKRREKEAEANDLNKLTDEELQARKVELLQEAVKLGLLP